MLSFICDGEAWSNHFSSSNNSTQVSDIQRNDKYDYMSISGKGKRILVDNESYHLWAGSGAVVSWLTETAVCRAVCWRRGYRSAGAEPALSAEASRVRVARSLTIHSIKKQHK